MRPRTAVAAIAALLALGLATGMAMAAAGDLDPSFDGDGRVTTDFTVSGRDRASDVAVQGDGKVVAVGRDAAGNFAVARYNADGSPDTTFDGDGKLTTPLVDSSNQSPGVAIQQDGKIVVAGGDGSDFAVARYNADGGLDLSFNDGVGIARTDFAGGVDYAVAVAIQADGKIVAGGNADAAAGGRLFAVARYDSDGGLDSNFGSVGRWSSPVPGATFQAASDVALQASGHIVVAGMANSGEDYFALARLDSGGAPDKTFDGDGFTTTQVNSGGAEAVAIAPGDARIVAAGGESGDFAIASYKTADGSPDTSFGGTGKVTTDIAGSDEARGVAIQPDGKIVAAGESDNSGLIDFSTARYLPDGGLDPSFAGDGTQTTGFVNTAASANDLTLQGDGKAVAVGATEGAQGRGDFALVRYQADPGPPPPAPPPPPPPPPPPGPKRLADLPDPIQGVLANVAPVAGRVFVGIPANLARAARAQQSQKGITFVPLTEARQIPVGSFLDTRRGTVRLQSARDRRGTRQQGDFARGLFQVLQSRRRSARGLTDLVLKGSSFTNCRRGTRGKRATAAASIRRRLRANARGRFRTRGRHSAATVRGTLWLTADRCDGTLTRVTRGRVAVHDFRRRRTVLVRAGKSYLARARR